MGTPYCPLQWPLLYLIVHLLNFLLFIIFERMEMVDWGIGGGGVRVVEGTYLNSFILFIYVLLWRRS